MKNMKTNLTCLAVIVVVFALFASLSLAQSNEEDKQRRVPKLRDFVGFKKVFGKVYAKTSENAHRAKLYLRRALHVFKNNILYLKRKTSKYLKINPTSDWTDRERESIFSALVPSKWHKRRPRPGTPPDHDTLQVSRSGNRMQARRHRRRLARLAMKRLRRLSRKHSRQNLEQLPERGNGTYGHVPGQVQRNKEKAVVYLDYRDTGCLAKPKSQLKCGACYIFSATTLFEFQHCKQTGKLVEFSEQYAIDCGRKSRLRGCSGGIEDWVGDFYSEFGLETGRKYPFLGHDDRQVCSLDEGRVRANGAKITSLEFARLSQEQVQTYLEERGPLTIAVYSLHDFADYGGGVDVIEKCSEKGGHAMVLIGHGREDGLDYWLVRNSHGEQWGLRGHYKMAKSSNRDCIIRIGYMQSVPKFKANRHRH